MDVRLASETDHSVLQDEIDNLRAKVDELTTEVGLRPFSMAVFETDMDGKCRGLTCTVSLSSNLLSLTL